MLKSSDNRTGKPVVIIYPGEYYAAKDDIYIATVVGTCLAVCIYDVKIKAGGMANFVVSGTEGTSNVSTGEISRIGVLNMEYLIGELVKLGGDRHHMKAKIFGAGYTDNSKIKNISIPENSIKFVREYFAFEKIEVQKSDLGGSMRKQIYYSPVTGSVYRRHLQSNDDNSEFITLEKEYVEREFKNVGRKGKIILFE